MEQMDTGGTTVSEPPPPSGEDTSTITPDSPPDHNQDQGTRTVDQVALSAKAAGLTNTTGPVQLLHFSAQLNSDEIKLLEVPGNVLQALKQGDKYVV